MISLSQSRLSSPRSRALAGTLAVLLVAVAVWGAAPTAAQADEPALRVVGGPVAEGETTTVSVVLTSAPDGLAGYYLDVSVAGDGARIAGAGYPDAFGLTTEPAIGADNRTVTLEAADLDGAVEPGATNATLATVTVVGTAPGEVEFSVDPRQFDGDRDGAFEPQPRPSSVTVTGPDGEPVVTPTPVPGRTTAAAAEDSRTDAGPSASGGEASGTAGADPTASDEPSPAATSDGGPLSVFGTLVAIATGTAVALRRHRR